MDIMTYPGEGRRRGLIAIRIGLVLALLAGWLVWWKWDVISSFASARADRGSAEVAVATAASESDSAQQPSELDLAGQRWEGLLGRPPAWPEDLSQPVDCAEIEADLTRICGALAGTDADGPLAGLGEPCAALRTAAEELGARPPDVRSELLSHGQMIENVFHLFRTLGRERVSALGRVLWEDQELAEPAGFVLARWLMSRAACAGSGRTSLTRDALYDWSAYFLTTLGGQAYMRRRTPRTEGLVSLWSLVMLDQAQREHHDPAGVDLRPGIERTRALLAREPLVFREHYLALLDGMAERRKEHTGSTGS